MSIHQMLFATLTESFIEATGGTVSFDGDFKIHTFLSNGTFEITAAPSGKTMDRLIVGGGGSGGVYRAGGGGAGGHRYETGLTVSVGSYSVVVGAGGAARTNTGFGTTGGTSSAMGASATGAAMVVDGGWTAT